MLHWRTNVRIFRIFLLHLIIQSVDSVSKDGPDTLIYIISKVIHVAKCREYDSSFKCCYPPIQSPPVSNDDLETRFEVDGTPKKSLSAYTSPLRLSSLLLITLSLWYSVGIGVS